MGSEQKAGLFKNVRKSRWGNVVYWTMMYTFVFLVATKYFIYEDGVVDFAFSMSTMYQHIALIGSIILGFLFIKKRNLLIPKLALCVLSALMIMFGAIFGPARTHVAYLVCLSVVLGLLADCSLLTYIYEMNNSERLYGIVFCHLLTAGVAVFSCFFTRETAVFWWVMFALSLAAVAACLFERREVEPTATIKEPFQNKLYVPLLLACVGGVAAVFSSMAIIAKLSPTLPNVRLFYYGGAAVGAIVYLLVYRFSPKPATVSLLMGFSTSVACIFVYIMAEGAGYYVSAALGGVTFNICMMNLYYILCNIIKKYDNPLMLRLAPISSNLVGGAIGVASVLMFFFADELAYKIVLSVCLAGDVVILSLSSFWQKGLSVTEAQEEYVRFDTTQTRRQAYLAVGLTEKEMEVADLLIDGLSLREIAGRLFVSENTAKTHRSNVYKKMQVGSRDELVAKLKDTVVA